MDHYLADYLIYAQFEVDLVGSQILNTINIAETACLDQDLLRSGFLDLFIIKIGFA